MNKLYLSAYLDGLLNMAYSLSKSIGPSSVSINCYDKKEFDKEYKIDYSPTSLSYEDKLKEWFIDEPIIVESILYWTNRYIKEIKKLYVINNKDLDLFKKDNPLYFIEDVFILETTNYMITFVLGNNE